MLLTFKNGEIRRYDATGDLGSDDVIKWLDTTFTNKIFKNGRISDSISSEKRWIFRNYAQKYQGIEILVRWTILWAWVTIKHTLP